MMNRYTQTMLIVLIFFIASCASVTKDIQVAAEADPKANFKGYKTYAWLGSAKIIHDPEGQWEPGQFDADSEIKWLIDRELRKRGMTEVTANPDMIIGFAAGIDMAALELTENPETKKVTVKNIRQGSLALIFVDAASGFPIWIGTAMGDLQQEPTPDTVRKRLDYAVSEMFELLPE
jgi:hypothetical protein